MHEHRARSSRQAGTPWSAGAIVVMLTLALVPAACGSGESSEQSDVATEPAITAASPTPAPSPTPLPSAIPTPTSEPALARGERFVFAGEVGGRPTRLPAGPYRTNELAVELHFDIPETTDIVRWSGVRDRERQMVIAISPPEPVPGPDKGAVPGLGISVAESGKTVEEIVAALLEASPRGVEPFLAAEPGLLLGREVTVISGELSGARAAGRWYVDLPDESQITMFAQPDRSYLIYVVDLDGVVLIIAMDAHPEQLDFIVTEGTRVIETLRLPADE